MNACSESMKILTIPLSEESKLHRMHQAQFYDACAKIRTAWHAMGYVGDPIMELFLAIQGMSVYGGK